MFQRLTFRQLTSQLWAQPIRARSWEEDLGAPTNADPTQVHDKPKPTQIDPQSRWARSGPTRA